MNTKTLVVAALNAATLKLEEPPAPTTVIY
jgi:hypothetical protein